MANAVVVGSGPNGLVAAIILARSNFKVTIYEKSSHVGGGMRSYINEEFLTIHDHCSAVHPMALLSPVFRGLGVHKNVEFLQPPVPFVHPGLNTRPGFRPLNNLSRSISTFSGVCVHSMRPPFRPISLGVGVALNGLSKTVGWPIVKGGTGEIARYLTNLFIDQSGEIVLNTNVTAENIPREIEDADIVIWDTSAEVAHKAAGNINKKIKYGIGCAKVDFVTNAKIPWRDAGVEYAGTVHLGGNWKEIRHSEMMAASGVVSENPVTLVSQPSLFDPSRAPSGLHTVWAYSHVPSASVGDPVAIVSEQIEKYAPGFGNTICAAEGTDTYMLECHNPNLVRGDILSGSTQGVQLLTSGRRLNPWGLPRRGWYLCSQTTAPGPGVHGINGYIATKLAIHEWNAR